MPSTPAQAGALPVQRLGDLLAPQDGAPLPPVLMVAVGLLAGRVGCTLREAQAYLSEMARDQSRDPVSLAADLVDTLPSAPAAVAPQRLAAAATTPPTLGHHAGEESEIPPATTAPAAVVQEMLDAVLGSHSWLLPVCDSRGEVVDFEVAATSPEAVDVAGRRGRQMLGVRIGVAYPEATRDIWATYLRVLADGQPREVGRMTYRHTDEGLPATATYSIRAGRLSDGLLVSWVRHDQEARLADRLAQTEHLGNLGWAEWDLITGETFWSDGLYRIYERDPASGPMGTDEADTLVFPDDLPLRMQATDAVAQGRRADVTFRIQVGGQVKHVHMVADAIHNSAGRMLRAYGILQDVTAREAARTRLADVQRQLAEHQRHLQAEHELAARLQQIILPLPVAPVDLHGLRVAIRYLPAEQASRVGGDWYHATALPDGRVLLAVGDVAGHGLAAATTMAQLRHGLAALAATTTCDPAYLLTHLNRLLYPPTGPAGPTATAVIGCFDPHNRALTWAQAGHPAPLHTHDGHTTPLPRPPGMLLGALPNPQYATASLTLAPGDLLLLHTDGLIEERGHHPTEGLARVIQTLDEIAASQSPAPLAELLIRLDRANPTDDTCLLGARLLT
jgi:serine phosphatase RsbU (regulator of sigma subunit)